MRQTHRSLIALVLAVSVPVAAWATCAERGAGSAGRLTCPMAANGDSCCCHATHGSDAVPDCCKVKTHAPQPTILMAPPPAADQRAAAMSDAGEVTDARAMVAARQRQTRADHVPLKFPHDPTYLRIAVLLI